MRNEAQLQGKTVIITGASRGIGKETAILLNQLGANLVLGARTGDELIRIATDMGENTLAIPVDVSDEQSVLHFVESAVERFGQIDAVVNSAGTGVFDSIIDLSVEDFDRMIAVNLKGTFLVCKYAGRHMARNHRGKIVNLISIAGTTALPGCGGYSASKFGALGLTKVLQTELRGKGVQVTAVLPGAVATPFWDGMEQMPDVSKMIPVQSLARNIVYVLCQPGDSTIDEITIMPPLGVL